LREREGEADEREPIRATPTGPSSSDALGTAPIRFKAIPQRGSPASTSRRPARSSRRWARVA